ncbi:ligand-gated channel [Burkholderia lata]|uniref:Ligand-gated channel n=2 Tax=Burkholderia lata (strain ATCC 17760 / DSM 23089 / LMG 22485 / NCIMB 9086 / R18194 / 383) TaxID=482957 RepID=A0A6P2T9A6_BURL3|nr:ligand-gated channel [Burkholderia lata]
MKVDTVSSEHLQKAGATQLSDYITSEPGVSFSSGGAPGQGTISIRGITAGQDIGPTVGVYVDDASFGSSTVYGSGAQLALNMGLLDLNHIEILFGPQGTLYGAGAMGGVLKYVTNQPDTENFSGQVGTGFSSTWHGGLNNTTTAVLNIPLKSDVAAVRLSAFNDHEGGYVDAVGSSSGTHINQGDTTGFRASALVTPTNKLTFRFTADIQDVNSSGLNFVDYGTNGRPVYGDLKRYLGSAEPYHQSIQFYTADVEYDFGWARFNSISSYQSIHTGSASDLTAAYAPIFDAAGLNLSAVSYSNQIFTDKVTQEFRLTSPGNQRLEWVAGLYYTHERSDPTDIIFASPVGSKAFSALETYKYGSTYEEAAAYGDLTYNLTPRLALTAGIRIARNQQAFDQTTSGPIVASPGTVSGTSSDTTKTYMFTAAYKLTPTSNVYARIASGYRPGGPNLLITNPATGLLIPGSSTFQPDTLWNYEVGYKADLLDKKLSLAVSAYDIEWHNLQAYGDVDGFSQYINAGNARVKGLQLSGAFRPTSAWTFAASISATDAYLTTGNTGAGSQAGDSLPNTPRFSATASVNYQFQIASHRAYVGVDEQYVGMRHSSFAHDTQLPDFKLPAYATTNLQAGIDFSHFTVSFFIRNLFNREGILSASTSQVPLGGDVLATVIQPRTIGVQLTAPF